jgi:hypothetical protein
MMEVLSRATIASLAAPASSRAAAQIRPKLVAL